MKTKHFFLSTIIILLFGSTGNATRINLNTYQWSDRGYYINGNTFPYHPGDTFVLSGNWNYCSMDHVIGTAAKHVVFINSGALNMTSGFSLEFCKYVDIVGTRTGSIFNFKIHNSRNGGVGVTIASLCHVIKVTNIEIYDKLYGMWIKKESNQTGCDSTQWYPHYTDSIIVEYNKIHDCNQEGIYGGSTDPGGVAAERAITCYGSTFTPRSQALKDIFVRFNTIYNTGRTPIQLSALSFGKYEVIGNTLTNGGFEVSLTQWPDIWIGGEGQAEGIIAYNICDSASRNNITFYGNNCFIHDNTTHHAGIARDINTGIVYRFSYYSPLAIEIKQTHPYTRTTYKVKDNLFVPTGTNVSVYVAGAAKDFTDTGNYICNSGTKLFTDNKVKYLDGCPDVIPPDSTMDTVKVLCDSMVTVTYDSTIYYDSVGDVILKTITDTLHYNYGGRWHGRDKHVVGAWTYHLSRDTTITRSYMCSKCAHCDSIFPHVAKPLLLGIMPFATANAYGIDTTRDAVNLQFWKTQTAAIARLKTYHAKNVTVNLSEKNFDLSPAHFYTDTTAYKAIIHEVHDSFPNIKHYVIGNEEGHSTSTGGTSPYYADSIQYYFPELKAALNELVPLGLDVTNGGLIFIRFWYYDKTHDSAFFQDCMNSTQRTAYNNGNLAYKISSTDEEINFLKALPKLRKINIHQLYVSSTAELAGLRRMLDYVKAYTGKAVTSNEVGYYVDDVNILIGLYDLAVAENFDELIYYSGDSGVTGPAFEIPEIEINQVIN